MPEAGRFRKDFVNTGLIRVPSQAVVGSPRAFAAADAGSAQRVTRAACPVAGREAIPCGPGPRCMRLDHAATGDWRRGPRSLGRERNGVGRRGRFRAPAADPWAGATAGGRRGAGCRRCRLGEARGRLPDGRTPRPGGRAAAGVGGMAGGAGIAGPGSTPRRSAHCGMGPGHRASGARSARSRAASSRARA